MLGAGTTVAGMTDVHELVHVAVGDGVATITLDSPANRNALSIRLVADLNAALDVAEAGIGDGVRAGDRGDPRAAGVLRRRRPQGAPHRGRRTRRRWSRALRRLMDAEVPTIAAVKGPARAGGIGLMASCDLVVVQRDLTFALTEVRIGVAAAIISVPILRRASGSRLAAALLTGEVFDAEFARDVGLVTHVTDDVDATVAALCAGIRMGAPRAVAETKRMLRTVPTMDARRGVRADAGARPTSCSRSPTPPRAWPPSPRSARPPGSRPA